MDSDSADFFFQSESNTPITQHANNLLDVHPTKMAKPIGINIDWNVGLKTL